MEADNLAIPPLVVIVGPTASGKTDLAIEMATRFNGEIICADSRSIYKGMNIGTAKPTVNDQKQVPHWGLDLVEPDEHFNVANFQSYAVRKIEEIRKRGHIPFLVGGTGLYVDAVIFDYQFGPHSDHQLRGILEKMTLEQLHKYCVYNNVELLKNFKNKRYIIRVIEQKSVSTKRRNEPLENSMVVGISTSADILRDRIKKRAEQLLVEGVVNEATILSKKYGWDNKAMTANIYPLIHNYLEKSMTLEELKNKFTTLDWHLAKRQMTWLRRNPYIHWGNQTEIREYLLQILANE